ncbi:hypothetical protein SteCoe_22551 [Stentor coeruleus]|uniref:Uncharacterized protein n=1 Tax=Stentor coeruleus TaxID=5963 RepID=A0A1R2BM19_9CILI|nr:hypothetical protein SteCoe_22551 [Stentor coeruleus]
MEDKLPRKRFVFGKENRIKKRSKTSDLFLLLTNISDDYKSSICLYENEFTPLIKEKPIGITFLSFSQITDRTKCIEMIESSNPQISMFSFDQSILLQKDPLALNLANEIDSIYAMTKNLALLMDQNITSDEQDSDETQLNNLEKETKSACRVYLSKIMLYLKDFFFTENTSDMCENKWADDIFLTHALFGVCCFLIFKFNRKSIGPFVGYLKCFEWFLGYIKEKNIHGNMRVFIIDFIYQIVFLKSQINYELDVLKSIVTLASVNEEFLSTKFTDLDSKFYDLMLAGHLKIAPEMKKSEYADFIRLFLNKVCFDFLPESISGFTCMNSVVFIRYPANLETELDYFPSQAFAFLTILHELGHFCLRKKFRLKSEWFNFETPKNSSAQTENSEGGTEFIIKIFGEEPLFATYYGSQYVLNIENWRNKSISDFRNEFFEESRKDPPSDDNEYKPVRLKSLKTDGSAFKLNYWGEKR